MEAEEMEPKEEVTDLVNCDFRQLYELANTGNADALKLLRKRCLDKPEITGVLGDMALWARISRVNQMVGTKALGRDFTVQEKVKAIERQLEGSNPTPLERLLIERILICWIDVQDHELRYAALSGSTFNQYEWRSRMLDRAHGRYLSAIKALANIRRLHLSIVQVNIADKQINTVGPGTMEPPQGDCNVNLP
jgi:hypothetical protein